MSNNLFKVKPLKDILASSQQGPQLKRTLSGFDLIVLGIGVIVGAGLFSITGLAAGEFAGPSVTISFAIAALGCAFAGLCYAEFASMIPVAGSAYTYSYATMGEFIAWIIGWDLILEYAVGAATVSISWSQYLIKFLANFGLYLPQELTMSPFDSVTLADGSTLQGIINLPAVFIVLVLSIIVLKGIKESAYFTSIIVILKLTVVFAFIILGWKYMKPENHTPYFIENTGTWGSFGVSGIMRAAGLMFFAYIGFDAVSTAAQETKNPSRNMPIGILGSLIICAILYILFAHVMTGLAHYTEFQNPVEALAPVAVAISHTPYAWLEQGVIVAILAGFMSVILVLLMSQSRVFYSMSKDGLVPKQFAKVHPKFQTPVNASILFAIFVSLFAAFVPGRVVGEMTSIGTLFAFTLVCIGIIVMRRKMPDAKRGFKTPFVPFVPIMGIVICVLMMLSLPLDTWIRLILWMLIGLDIYYFYGFKHSNLNAEKNTQHPKALGVSIIATSALLILVANIHHYFDPSDTILFTFSVIFGLIHILYHIFKMFVRKQAKL